ncbi:MAG: hypothetical protein RL432_1152 [Bacteroidota bacterium]|jgi:hypothetical protein
MEGIAFYMDPQSMIIQSDTLVVKCSLVEAFDFLSQPANIEFLLPKERVSDFKSDEQRCEFKVQGGIVISLMFQEKHEEGILYKSGSKAPFPFTLQITVKSIEGGIEGYLRFNGEAPAMVAMLAKNPLTALFNDMGQNLKKRLEEQG